MASKCDTCMPNWNGHEMCTFGGSPEEALMGVVALYHAFTTTSIDMMAFKVGTFSSPGFLHSERTFYINKDSMPKQVKRQGVISFQ